MMARMKFVKHFSL